MTCLGRYCRITPQLIACVTAVPPWSQPADCDGQHAEYAGIEYAAFPANRYVLLCGAAYLERCSDGAPFQDPSVSER
jgi:hypothetical protein